MSESQGTIGIEMTMNTPEGDKIRRPLQPDEDFTYNTTASKNST
jgi:hypothetical protein